MNYPSYIKIKDESIKNNGDLIIPEGTIVHWDASLKNTKTVTLVFSESKYSQSTDKTFNYKKQFFSSTTYQIITLNEYQLSDSLSYFIKVIPDALPLIKVNQDFAITLLVIEHNMKVIMQLAENIFCLAHGKMLANGTPDQIKNDKRVVDAYLGAQ